MSEVWVGVCGAFVRRHAGGGRRATRSVRGVVSDENGKPVSGAAVQLKDLRTQWIGSYISQKDGSYQFTSLTPH